VLAGYESINEKLDSLNIEKGKYLVFYKNQYEIEIHISIK
jgi:hypothetical protein